MTYTPFFIVSGSLSREKDTIKSWFNFCNNLVSQSLLSLLSQSFFCIPASIADEAADKPKIGKAFITNGVATFNNGPATLDSNLPKKPPDWTFFLAVIWLILYQSTCYC